MCLCCSIDAIYACGLMLTRNCIPGYKTAVPSGRDALIPFTKSFTLRVLMLSIPVAVATGYKTIATTRLFRFSKVNYSMFSTCPRSHAPMCGPLWRGLQSFKLFTSHFKLSCYSLRSSVRKSHGVFPVNSLSSNRCSHQPLASRRVFWETGKLRRATGPRDVLSEKGNSSPRGSA